MPGGENGRSVRVAFVLQSVEDALEHVVVVPENAVQRNVAVYREKLSNVKTDKM